VSHSVDFCRCAGGLLAEIQSAALAKNRSVDEGLTDAVKRPHDLG